MLIFFLLFSDNRFCGLMQNVKICFRGKVSKIQSTLVISNSKGLSETLRDVHTSTYQIFRIEEKTTTFNKFICNWILDVRDISKILWKRGEIAENFTQSAKC